MIASSSHTNCGDAPSSSKPARTIVTTTVATNGRNIWKTKRDRERMYARHEIRERVLLEGDEELSISSSAASSLSKSNSCNIRSLFCSIEKRDIAAFGIAKLVKNLSTTALDGLHPAYSYLNLQKAYYMCASRFGVEFGKSALKYLEYIRGISLIAYAAMLGEYQIVSNLLKGGADPTGRASPSCDGCCFDTAARSLALQQKFHRLFFLDYFPPMFAVWIVRCVVVMRINGLVSCLQENTAITTMYETLENKEKQNNASHPCSICKEESSQYAHLLNWGAPCYHSFCECCCWDDILNHMDERDEILCPICLAVRNDQPKTTTTIEKKKSHNNCNTNGCRLRNSSSQQESLLSTMATPMERFRASLEKFNALPRTKDHIADAAGNNETTASFSRNENDLMKAMVKHSNRKNTVDTSWSSSLVRYMGRTQDARHDAFFHFVARNAIHYVKGLLEAGVHVDDVNEYNQTNLYIASWYGHTSVVKLLLFYGADPNILPYGASSMFFSSTALSVAKAHDHEEIVDVLSAAAAIPSNSSGRQPLEEEGPVLMLASVMETTALVYTKDKNKVEWTSIDNTNNTDATFNRLLAPSPKLTILIPSTMKDHPGAGSFIIDHTISEITLQQIEVLWESLPVDYGRKGKENSITCATRSYFCDAENVLTKHIANQLNNCLLLLSQQRSVVVMPHMRFLHYAYPNISLPSHVDLARVDRFGRRSSHSFLLYLFDCEQGGETVLRRRQVSCASKDQNEEAVIVKPRRGRLLVFPHLCPHEGGAVVSVPKVLIRGEIYMGC